MNSLFDMVNEEADFKPLAEKMRPEDLDDFVGQEEVVGKNSAIRKMIESDLVTSMIFWGPPGVGKTTLAKIIAHKTSSYFHELSAVTSGVKEIKEIIEMSKLNKMNGKKTILFVDEIHRFNKAQQDAFLPFVENGDIILIGATTENPSFEVNSALLSRTKVYVLNSLSEENIISILKRANEKYYANIHIAEECFSIIANFSNGDARSSLNTLENMINTVNKKKITKKDLESILHNKTFLYDKNGEEHYNLISALHKSMRNSDPDAAIYWMSRMFESGEDPLYIARRIVRFASEDIGLADTNALNVAINVYQACHFLGYPECNVHLTEAVVYMSLAPKSNALYVGYETAKKDALTDLNKPVPLNIRNAPTKLMKELKYGSGYEYAHDTKDKLTTMDCLPENLINKCYYNPTDQGNEIKFKQRLEQIKSWKQKHKDSSKNS